MSDRVMPDWWTRFWAKVSVLPSGCWVWTASIRKDGYGRFMTHDRRADVAHRVGYITLVGPLPDKSVLDHLCRNRACVNPAHLAG